VYRKRHEKVLETESCQEKQNNKSYSTKKRKRLCGKERGTDKYQPAEHIEITGYRSGGRQGGETLEGKSSASWLSLSPF